MTSTNRTNKRRRAITRLLLAILTVGLLHLAPSTFAPTPAAYADTATCTLGPSGTWCPSAPPAELLGPDALAAATGEQAASLRRLSDQAITNTLSDHGLPASDRDAAATWARADAQAELFALIVEAIKTSAADRTADQRNAVDWMTELVRAKAERAAQHAGAEYAKWAGVDLTDYWRIVKDSATTEADLASFLSDASHITAGSCTYRPPAPYQDDYDGSRAQTCYTPCTSPLGCQPNTPSYDSFVKWGQAATTNADTANTGEVAVASSEIAISATFGGAVIAATAGIVTTAVLESVLTMGSLLPLFASPIVVPGVGLATAGGIASSVGWTAAEAAAGGGAVAVVIMAVIIAVLEGIKVSDAASLPAKLASLAIGARTTAPDLVAQLADTDKAAGIFGLFVQATLPLPRLGGTCDGTTTSTDLGTRPCLNPPDVPAPAATDPHFVVADLQTGATTTSPTITLADPASDTTATVRVHGNWFIGQLPGTDLHGMSLAISYIDASGTKQRTWLVRDDRGRYWFVGVSAGTTLDAATCQAQGTCWVHRSIAYLGPDGHLRAASIEPTLPPVGTPGLAVPGPQVEATPVTFRANGFAPAGAVSPVTYSWRFHRDGCGISCTAVTSNGQPGGISTGPSYGDPVTGPGPNGDLATHTWQTSGTFQVELTATDRLGTRAVIAFPVQIAGVPPVLTLDPATATSGGTIAITGTLDHAGTNDSESLSVFWGDGSTDQTTAGPGTLTLAGNPLTLTHSTDTRYRISASHTYARPGTYEITVTVVDQAGHTTTRALMATTG